MTILKSAPFTRELLLCLKHSLHHLQRQMINQIGMHQSARLQATLIFCSGGRWIASNPCSVVAPFYFLAFPRIASMLPPARCHWNAKRFHKGSGADTVRVQDLRQDKSRLPNASFLASTIARHSRMRRAKNESVLPESRFDSEFSTMTDSAVRVKTARHVDVPVVVGKSSEPASAKLPVASFASTTMPSVPSPLGALERSSFLRTTSSGNFRLARLLRPKVADRRNL